VGTKQNTVFFYSLEIRYSTLSQRLFFPFESCAFQPVLVSDLVFNKLMFIWRRDMTHFTFSCLQVDMEMLVFSSASVIFLTIISRNFQNIIHCPGREEAVIAYSELILFDVMFSHKVFLI
jgi:hypothetical protein